MIFGLPIPPPSRGEGTEVGARMLPVIRFVKNDILKIIRPSV